MRSQVRFLPGSPFLVFQMGLKTKSSWESDLNSPRSAVHGWHLWALLARARRGEFKSDSQEANGLSHLKNQKWRQSDDEPRSGSYLTAGIEASERPRSDPPVEGLARQGGQGWPA